MSRLGCYEPPTISLLSNAKRGQYVGNEASMTAAGVACEPYHIGGHLSLPAPRIHFPVLHVYRRVGH